MPGQDYWRKRYLRDKALSVNKAEKLIRNNQKKYYEQASKEILDDIEKFYAKYAKENKVSLSEAKKRISNAEFRDIDWEAYCQEGMELGQKLENVRDSLPGDFVAALEKSKQEHEKNIQALAVKGNITRLELLQQDIEKTILKTYNQNQVTVYDYLRKEYEDGYYKGIFNIQQGIGFGKNFAQVHTRAVEKVILSQKKRDNFSKTLYKHQKNLTREIRDCLSVGMIRGESVDKLAKRVQQRIDVSYSNAKRLVRTETGYAFEQATLDSYAECGIEKYRFMATLDNKTSSICRELDGKEFYVKDAVPGVNYPPMHPNCRSTTVAVHEKESVTERAARRDDGTGYTVPSNMTYKEWRARYVSGGPQLDNDEQYAINQYISFDSYKINDKLRYDRPLTAYDKKMIKDLDSALDRMNNYIGNVVRVLNIEDKDAMNKFMEEHQVGNTVTYKEYLSSSNKEGYNPGSNIKIYINSSTGKNIMAYNPDESEVLYKRNSSFVVKEIIEQDGVTYILMEENNG